MMYVIGSGPAGIACASALLEKGREVTMLDAGVELEPDNRRKVEHLASTDPARWTPEDVRFMKSSVSINTRKIPVKKVYGSDFPYLPLPEFLSEGSRHLDIFPSFARGGLSNVWGAAVLPHREEDIRDWPVRIRDLEPHYRAVLGFVPLAAAQDDLAALYPLYAQNPGTLRLGRGTGAFLQHLEIHKDSLRGHGILFGRSRLAVKGETKEYGGGCVHCGLCLYGCPLQCIYCSSDTLREWTKSPRFTYRGNTVVTRVQETGDRVAIEGKDRLTGEKLSFSGTRVFLAAGILPTTHILLDSLKIYNQPLKIRYSQYFNVPLIRFRGEPDDLSEATNTLAQVFVELLDPVLTPETIHLQIYGYNDLYGKAMENSLAGPLFKLFPPLKEAVLRKLLIIQGYLHSRHSGFIELTLRNKGTESVLKLVPRENASSRRIIRRVMSKLWKHKELLGAFPLTPWLKIGPLGMGAHNTGTFPMSAAPGPLESDRWGRPAGLRRVHAVDASVLPSAPASTITLTVMANAHRIGYHDEAD